MDQASLKLEAALRARLGWAHAHSGPMGVYIDTICPVCHKKKLSVNARTGYYKCWRECGSGSIAGLLGPDFKLDTSAIPVVVDEGPPRFMRPGDVCPLTSLDDDHHCILYLKERGFDPAKLESEFGVGYCWQGDWFATPKGYSDCGRYNTTDTLVFPMRRNNQILAWQSRLLFNPDILTEAECYAKGMVNDPEDGKLMRWPKYFTMPGFRKGTMLFNYDGAKLSEVVVVTEGVFDVFAVGRCAVACLGKGVSQQQQTMLMQGWKLALLLLDPDAAKENAMLKARLTRQGMPSLQITLTGAKDAGDTDRVEIWRQIINTCNKANIDLSKYSVTI